MFIVLRFDFNFLVFLSLRAFFLCVYVRFDCLSFCKKKNPALESFPRSYATR